MNEPEAPEITVIPAATVVIFRQPRGASADSPPELLMVQRANEMRFAGGAAVFPGGRIDEADRLLAAQIATDPCADLEEIAARIAGIRETLEETGLVLAASRQVCAEEAAKARRLLLAEGALAPVLGEFGWRLELDALVPFARWCPRFARSFDTRFYLADIGTGAVDLAVDATENSRLFWMSAAGALRAADAGEISVIFPTRRNLERLAQFASYAEAAAHAAITPIVTISPRHVERDGETWLTIPEGLGYPVLGQPLAGVKRG